MRWQTQWRKAQPGGDATLSWKPSTTENIKK